MTEPIDIDDLALDELEYHGSTCLHPACHLRTLQLDIARAKSRRRRDRPKAKIDFDPLAERFTW